MPELIYRVSGLSEFTISFENYCVPCKMQQRCKYGKKNPFQINIDCNDLLQAYEKKRYELMRKAQKEASIEDTYEDIEKRVKVNMGQIFSGIWKSKIKALKEEILCMNSKRTDSILTTQRGGEWWSEFRAIMKKIYDECQKIQSIGD